MSRLEWILTGLLAILVVFVLALLLLFWSEQRQAENFNRQIATQNPAAQRGTAQVAYEVAAPAARAWAADALLLHARGNWPRGATFVPESGSWSFIFYSPRQQAVALVTTSGINAQVVSADEIERAYTPASLEGWQVDSPLVVEQLLANGGQAFIEQYGDVSLKVTLNATGRLVWNATLIATDANKLFRLQIDPVTGQVIE